MSTDAFGNEINEAAITRVIAMTCWGCIAMMTIDHDRMRCPECGKTLPVPLPTPEQWQTYRPRS